MDRLELLESLDLKRFNMARPAQSRLGKAISGSARQRKDFMKTDLDSWSGGAWLGKALAG